MKDKKTIAIVTLAAITAGFAIFSFVNNTSKLKANSKLKSRIAPAANDNSVAVTPLARYLFKTIITNNDGAKAHIPIIKLLINNMTAVVLSWKSCLIKLVIICVFNEYYYSIGFTCPNTLCNWKRAIIQSNLAFSYATSLIRCAVFIPNTAIIGELPA